GWSGDYAYACVGMTVPKWVACVLQRSTTATPRRSTPSPARGGGAGQERRGRSGTAAVPCPLPASPRCAGGGAEGSVTLGGQVAGQRLGQVLGLVGRQGEDPAFQ